MRQEPWKRQAHRPWSQELLFWPPGEHLGGRNAIWGRVLSEVRRGFPLQQISFEAVIRGAEGLPCEVVGWQEQERAFSRRRLLISPLAYFSMDQTLFLIGPTLVDMIRLECWDQPGAKGSRCSSFLVWETRHNCHENAMGNQQTQTQKVKCST